MSKHNKHALQMAVYNCFVQKRDNQGSYHKAVKPELVKNGPAPLEESVNKFNQSSF